MSRSATFRPSFLGLVVAISLAIPWVRHFGRALVQREVFAFRDAGHFYFPLSHLVATLRQRTPLPLWNPYDNLGQPLAADPTAAVFYPLNWWLTWSPSAAAGYAAYVAAHAAWAAVSMYGAARALRHSVGAAGCAALSYAFGGYVLAQHANVVYLVSASWLPSVLLFGERWVTVGGRGNLLGLSATLALTVLGGDPQTAYHALLVLALRVAWRCGVPSSVGSDPAPACARRGSRLRPLGRLLGGAACAACLAGVQVSLSLGWARDSDRGADDRPRSLVERLGRWGNQDKDVSSAVPDSPPARPSATEAGGGPGHAGRIYVFSFAPWRLAELIWPNCSGKLFPTYRRWTQAALGEQRIWFPSLYLGAAPLLLAAAAWGQRRGDGRRQWLAWAALLALLASFGDYGVAGCLSWLPRLPGLDGLRQLAADVPPAVGGLYWWLVQLLPGYAYFRFPAKWLVVMSWAMALLAAAGWDDWRRGRGTAGVAVVFRYFLGLTGACLLVVLGGRTAFLAWAARAEPDSVFGPLLGQGAWWDLVASFLHTLFVVGLVLRLCAAADRPEARFPWRAACLLVLTAADLLVAHGWQVPTVAAGQFAAPPAAQAAMLAAAPDNAGPAPPLPLRVYRSTQPTLRPESWRRSSSPARIAELVRWEYDTLYPRYHLLRLPTVSLLGSVSPALPADLAALLRVARRHGPAGRNGAREPDPRLLAALGIRYAWLPPDIEPPGATGLPVPRDLPAIRGWRLPSPLPRAWVVHRFDRWQPLRSRQPADVERRTEETLYPRGTLRDLRQSAALEAAGALPLPPDTETGPATACTVVDRAPGILEITVELSQPGLLVVNESYSSSWEATVTNESGEPQHLPVWRTNRVMCGVWLAGGRHQVRLRFRPPWGERGLWLTLPAWVFWFGIAFWEATRFRETVSGGGAGGSAKEAKLAADTGPKTQDD